MKTLEIREKNVDELVGVYFKIIPISSFKCSRQLILVSN